MSSQKKGPSQKNRLEVSTHFEGLESPEEILREAANLRNARSWDLFIQCFNRVIFATVIRTMRSYGVENPEVAKELTQDVFSKLASNNAEILRNFKPRHGNAAFGYLRVIAANVAHDYLRSSQGRPIPCDPLSEDMAGPDEQGRIEWSLLLREIHDFLRTPDIPERDRQIFWLYYERGMSAKEIAQIRELRLGTKGVESVIQKLSKLIRQAFKGRRR